MNSVQQTILGLVLVGIAFIFGSYLHRDDGTQTADTQQDAQSMQDLSWQGTGSSYNSGHQSSLPTMRKPQLQLSQQNDSDLQEANLVPDLAPSRDAQESLKDLSYTIAEPDFSRFEFETEEVAPPKPVESSPKIEQVIATPSFENHFPNELRSGNPVQSNLGNITPKRPERDLRLAETSSTLDSDSVIPKKVEVVGKMQPLNPNSRLINVRRATLETETQVAPIRPRNSSPIMANTTRFKSHRTVEGETLQQLAVKYFGDPNYYLDIYVANKSTLSNPNELPAGTQLRIPVYE